MNKSFRTFLKHTAKDYYNQSVNPPVVRASTIIFKTMKIQVLSINNCNINIKTERKCNFLKIFLASSSPFKDNSLLELINGVKK